MSFDEIRNIALFALALYGAILSTLNWYSAKKKDLQSIRMSLNTVTPYSDLGLGEPHFQITATNSGFRDVTVSNIFLALPGKKNLYSTIHDQFVQPDTRLPSKLSSGDAAVVHISYPSVAHAMKKEGFSRATSVRPACFDSLGKLHLGEALKLDPDELLKVSTNLS